MEEGKQNTDYPLSEEDLRVFEQLLLKEKDKVESNIKYLQEITGSPENEQNGGHIYGDFADRGTDANEREKNFLYLSRDLKYLKQINAALERIKKRTYGICSVTGLFIGEERLKAVLTTTKCIAAKNLQPL